MRIRRGLLPLIGAAVLLGPACSAGPSGSTSRPDPGTGSATAFGSGTPADGPDGFTTTELAAFDSPWAAAFLPGTPWLAVTEKRGTLKLRDMTTGRVIDVAGTPEVLDEGQGGLGDVVPSPGFDGKGNRTLYLTWAEAGEGSTAGAAMGRGRLEVDGGSARLAGFEVLWRQQPKVEGRGHYSHRIAFSPDGRYLFLSSGERQAMTPAQDLGVNLGKILRLDLDGKAAPGNPFADRGGVSAQIWSYGHRNALGLAFDGQGRLWESEMGPKGGDEVNLIEEAANYGWPLVSNGSHYDGTPIPDHAPGDGYAAPKVWWDPSISPGSLMVYSGTLFPGWAGDAFVGALSGEALVRVDLDGTSAKKAEQWPMGARIREVESGPDGAIYVLEDGSGGRLLRLAPA
jgi:glucose/arabinose dehydrogenase